MADYPNIEVNITAQQLENSVQKSAGQSTEQGGEIFNDYDFNQATGQHSHADGQETQARGKNSHASGYRTIARYKNQFVCGQLNDNKEDTLFEVGNGDDVEGSSVQSNAFEVYKDGHAEVQTMGASDNSVATRKFVRDMVGSGDTGGSGVSKEYVDNAIGALEDDVAYLSTHAATKQYVDDAVASSGGVSSWNDLTDKPFYDEGTKTATLDYADLPNVSQNFGEVTLYKVTDDILTEEILKKATISAKVTNDDGEEITESTTINSFMGENEFEFGNVYLNMICGSVIYFIAVATKTGEFDIDGTVYDIKETGTYFALQPNGTEIPNLMSLEYEYIKPLDIKFIPEALYTEIDQRIESYINEALGGDY